MSSSSIRGRPKGAKARRAATLAKRSGSSVSPAGLKKGARRSNSNKIPSWFQSNPPRKKQPTSPNGKQLTKSGIAELEQLKQRQFSGQLDTLKTQSFRLNCTLRAQLQEVKRMSGKHVSASSKAVRKLTPEQAQKRNQLVSTMMRNIKTKSFFTDLIPIVRERGPRIFACDHVNLWYLNKETSMMELLLTNNEKLLLAMDQDLVGTVAAKGQVTNLASGSSDSRYMGVYDEATGYLTSSILCVPCSDAFGQPLAILELLGSKSGRFDAGDERIAKKMCRAMAMYLK